MGQNQLLFDFKWTLPWWSEDIYEWYTALKLSRTIFFNNKMLYVCTGVFAMSGFGEHAEISVSAILGYGIHKFRPPKKRLWWFTQTGRPGPMCVTRVKLPGPNQPVSCTGKIIKLVPMRVSSLTMPASDILLTPLSHYQFWKCTVPHLTLPHW